MGTVFAGVFFELWLVIEQLQLGGRSNHLEVDNPFHFGSHLRKQRRERRGRIVLYGKR